MQIQKIQPNTTFTSLKNPIKTEKFLYKDGFVIMREAEKSDLIDVARNIKRWMTQNYRFEHCMGNTPEHKEARELFRALDKNKWLREIKQYLVDLIKNGEGKSSILVARDQDNKLVGYATMKRMDNDNPSTAIIEDIHLNYHYRDGNLGKQLLKKITDTAQDQFKEIIVGSYSLGDRSIYYNEGYKPIKSEPYRKFLQARYNGVDSECFWLRKEM